MVSTLLAVNSASITLRNNAKLPRRQPRNFASALFLRRALHWAFDEFER